MARTSHCADCGATVVVTTARTQFRGGAMVLVCRSCAGEPASSASDRDYDEMVVGIAEDIDESYDDVEVSIDAEPAEGDRMDNGRDSATVSGALEVEERAQRQKDPTLPPVMIDKAH